MSRVQLALNVSDLETAVEFYSTLFQTTPAKVRPGYANFAIDDPALKLVLIENAEAGGTINHLGVEVETPEDVAAAMARLDRSQLVSSVDSNVECCFAVQDKVWADGPDGEAWEIYTVLADADQSTTTTRVDDSSGVCCAAPDTVTLSQRS